MLRFYQRENYEILYTSLNEQLLADFFCDDNYDKIVCVKSQDEKYLGNITWKAWTLNQNIEKAINRDKIIFDLNIWKNGEKYFRRKMDNVSDISMLAVVDENERFLFWGYQDDDANEELRMLRELWGVNLLNFGDIFPVYDSVEIYGINELAYRFVEYLNYCGIPTRVHGDIWKRLGIVEQVCCGYKNSYVIYAEGVWQIAENLYNEVLRSVSVCFECIDKIYEANIRAGKIRKCIGGEIEFIDYIKEKTIAIIGTDLSSAEVYDYLLGKGVHVSLFVDMDQVNSNKYMFGKPILSCQDAFNYDSQLTFLECHGTDSRWGLNGTDFYDYHGYYRNENFFFVKDYLKSVQKQLKNVVKSYGEIILFGLLSMCEYLKNQDMFKNSNVQYIDLLGEISNNDYEIKYKELGNERLCLFVCPEFLYEDSQIYKKRIKEYTSRALIIGLTDYSDYFTKNAAYIDFECDYSIDDYLKPRGIMLGAIDGNSGNILFNGILDEHPNIIKMDSSYLKENLFSICIRLSKKTPREIMSVFWGYYEKEADHTKETILGKIRNQFNQEMSKILAMKRQYTSQELFVAFHIGYLKAVGGKFDTLSEMIIYWESHYSSREQMESYACWLKINSIDGYIVNMTRHSCTRAGSYFSMCCRFEDILEKKEAYYNMLQAPTVRKEVYDGYKRIILSFEKTKVKPKEVLRDLCNKLNIPWSEKMLCVTNHGKESITRNGIKGFDLKPVFNQYNEYFSGYDKMRVMLLTAPWQRSYGYSYINCSDFTRYDLQELILKDFCFEKYIAFSTLEEERVYRIRKIKWLKNRIRVIYREMQQEEEAIVY